MFAAFRGLGDDNGGPGSSKGGAGLPPPYLRSTFIMVNVEKRKFQCTTWLLWLQ